MTGPWRLVLVRVTAVQQNREVSVVLSFPVSMHSRYFRVAALGSLTFAGVLAKRPFST
jgi:hypothetical protein